MQRILSESINPKQGLPSFVPEPQSGVHHDTSTIEVEVLKQEPPDPAGEKRLWQSVPAIFLRLHRLWTHCHDPQFRSDTVTMIMVAVTLVFLCVCLCVCVCVCVCEDVCVSV